jgi:UDPglucose 6-dehydrogenase
MAQRIQEAAGGSLKNQVVAVLGVTFKPNTDDMREAPSLVLVPMLQERGARVQAYDPHGREAAAALLPDVFWCDSAIEAAKGADVTVILTEWNEFRALDLAALKDAMRGKALVDLKNIYSPDQVASAGLTYTSIGR